MDDKEILYLANKLNGLIVTHDRRLAKKAPRVLFIKSDIPGEKIADCTNIHYEFLKENNISCEESNCEMCYIEPVTDVPDIEMEIKI